MSRKLLTRYWFEFHTVDKKVIPSFCGLGIGVTARDVKDAYALVRGEIFNGESFPHTKTVTANIDIRNLDQKHIAPNMNEPASRGIWFPRLCNAP